MNIGIDIDDTISETFETLLPYSQKYVKDVLLKKPNLNYNVKCDNHLYIEAMNNWNDEERIEFWKKYYAEMLENVNIKKFAAETINRLRKKGNKIFLITARWNQEGQDTNQITMEWLKKHNVQYDELIIEARKKIDIIKQKCIDVFIDDSFDNCKSAADNLAIKVLMMNSKANERYYDEKVTRVYSWPEIEYLIENDINITNLNGRERKK